MIKAIIYDVNGTMVNSVPLHDRAWRELLRHYGYEYDDLPVEMRSGFIGMRVLDVLRDITVYLRLSVNVKDVYNKRREIFLAIAAEELELMPGLMSSLMLFKKNKYKVAIASSGAKKYIELVLTKFRLNGYFDVIITGDDVLNSKPNPEIYLSASKKLGFFPSECLAFEDSAKGVQAAKDAGCKCIAVENACMLSRSNVRADAVVGSLNEVNLTLVCQFD